MSMSTNTDLDPGGRFPPGCPGGPGRARRLREPPGRLIPCHQKRAGLGVWACTRSREDRAAIRLWKRREPFDRAELEGFAAAVADLVRAWSPILPPGTVVCCPPRGVSDPAPSAAEALGRRVAEALGLPFDAAILSRTGPKRRHGVQPSLTQAPFVAALPDPPPPLLLIIDDLVTTGTTMRRSLEAIRAAGCAAFGFAYSGC